MICTEAPAVQTATATVTYAQLQQQALAASTQLAAVPAQVVLIPMTRTIQTVVQVVACQLSQRPFVPVAPHLSQQQLQAVATHFRNAFVWGRICQVLSGQAQADALPADTLFVGFTSGTTGVPKGFVRNQASWQTSFQYFQQVFQLPLAPVAVLTPLHYSLGLYALLQTLHNGQCFLLNATHLSQTPAHSIVFAVPAVLQHQLPTVAAAKVTVVLGGEQVTPSLRQAFCQKMPVSRLVDFYGASETSFIAANTQQLPPAQTVGRLFPNVQLHLARCHASSCGEIQIQSPQNFQGYWQDGHFTPAATWVSTGDIGCWMGEQLVVCGRKDRRINRKGEKFFPEQLVARLQQHPAIAAVQITGKTRVTATIVWQTKPLTLAALNQFLAQQPGRKAKIDQVVTVQQLPQATSGKGL